MLRKMLNSIFLSNYFCDLSWLEVELNQCIRSFNFNVCAQSCPNLCDPMDYSLPVSSVHRILLTIITWVGCCWEPAYYILSAYCILSAALSTAPSFRIWNSSTRILSLPGASVRHSAHDKGHEEGGSAYAKAGWSLRSPPRNSRASTPKTRVCLLSALCFHLHLWLYGGLSPTTSLWKKS